MFKKDKISREEVVWCYQHLLGRPPESEAAIRSHLGHKGFKQMVDCFVSSPEFSARQNAALSPFARREMWHAIGQAANAVDLDASAEQLAACVKKIQAAWVHLGNEKPHYSVLTDARFLPDQLADSADSFWASGEQEAATLQRILGRYGVHDLSDKVCVEYGCGVGRVTMGLAARFGQVHGYDISASHLKIAQERADALGVDCVCLHDSSALLETELMACDCFYSRIVFQHNPPPVIARLIEQALAALKPGGIALFQVPTYGVGYRFRLQEWLQTEHPLDMQMHCLPQPHIFRLIAAAGCAVLEVREDNCTGAPERFVSNTFIVRKTACVH